MSNGIAATGLMLVALGGAAFASSNQSLSTLEELVGGKQAAVGEKSHQTKFDILWDEVHKDFVIRELYSNGVVVHRTEAHGDYVAELAYIGKEGTNGKLTGWTVAASAYTKSDPKTPVYRMQASGNVGPNGRFSMETTSISIERLGNGYDIVAPIYATGILPSVAQGTPSDVAWWVDGMTVQYAKAKSGTVGLQPMPSNPLP